MRPDSKLELLLKRVIAVERGLCEFMIVAMALLIMTEAVCRGFLGFSLLISDEIATYLVISISFFGMGVALGDNALFRVSFLFEALPPKASHFTTFLFNLIALACASILAWQILRMVRASYERGAVAPTTLGTPLYLPQALMALGMLSLVLILILRLLQNAQSFSRYE